ncbi:MAG: hypothetical protein MZV49_08005 [Rhodopseudomonas palustris]|nr:hypothetical protein [Rhodopseudomonas palustris]
MIHRDHDVGTYVGPIRSRGAPYGGAAFFSVSRRRIAPGSEFAGVIQASLLPEYFEGFYAKIRSATDGGYAALVREDGAILARDACARAATWRLTPDRGPRRSG